MTTGEPGHAVRGRSAWRRSSYSAENGNCVEVAWRTSTYSAQNGGCVEVAPAPVGVLVRDSKDPGGPALAVSPQRWRDFLSHTR